MNRAPLADGLFARCLASENLYRVQVAGTNDDHIDE
jgi:hypothetical protein